MDPRIYDAWKFLKVTLLTAAPVIGHVG